MAPAIATAGVLARSSLCTLCQRTRTPRQRAPYSVASNLPRTERGPRCAIIGSGPAGFYTAHRIFRKVPKAKVDMYESLPVPFGLVRYGVAPDHPEVKNCQDTFEGVGENPDFTFIGNVSVGIPSNHPEGSTIPLSTILRHYDAVVFAYGASKDKLLGIPGESDLKGIYSAREFVGWYNGLPEFANLAPDLTQGEEAVVIGQGNVALDVARMLVQKVDELRKTDIVAHAIETLSRSKIKRVHVVGRRGPVQAAFTTKEIRELTKIASMSMHNVPGILVENPEALKQLPPAKKRQMELLRKGSNVETSPKAWSLDFCLSPTRFGADPSKPDWIGHTEFEQMTLASPLDPSASPSHTGKTLEILSSVAFRSIGYKLAAMPEFSELSISFDRAKGIIRNDGVGRVMAEIEAAESPVPYKPFPGLYCAGWAKRGPTGTIASTMNDAFATAESLAEDWAAPDGSVAFLNKETGVTHNAGWEGVRAEIDPSKAKIVHWTDWRQIDRAERERVQTDGKPREKFTQVADMLAVLD